MFLYQKLIDRSTLRQGFSLLHSVGCLSRIDRKNAKWNTAKRQRQKL